MTQMRVETYIEVINSNVDVGKRPALLHCRRKKKAKIPSSSSSVIFLA
jgi:hypothetical protein